MTYGKRYKKKYNKKRKVPRSLISRPFPVERTVKMRYCQTVSLDAAGATTDHVLFRANSIFDPYEPLGGHQPYGHDQWEVVYNHYVVTKSKISVTVIPTNSASAFIGIVGIALKDDTTVETDFDTIREATNSKWTYAVAQKNNKVTNSFSRAVMFRNEQNDSTKSRFGSDPNEQAYYQIFATGVISTGDPSPVNCVVTIDYTVKMWELKDLGKS